MTTTHYLITANHEAIGVTAADVDDALNQAVAMGLGAIVIRIDAALSQIEWDAALAGETPVAVLTLPKRTADEAAAILADAELTIEGHDHKYLSAAI